LARQLELKFIYDGKKRKPSPMGEDVSLTMALVMVEGHRSRTVNLQSLSRLTFPFWIVQASESTSLLLTSFGDRVFSIEISGNICLFIGISPMKYLFERLKNYYFH